MNRRARTLALALLLVLAPAACGPKREAPRPEDAAARSQALIESGNEAYRRNDWELAAKRYAAAAVQAPEDPAAYYGLGMALSKLGRDEQAREAYSRARDLAQKQRP